MLFYQNSDCFVREVIIVKEKSVQCPDPLPTQWTAVGSTQGSLIESHCFCLYPGGHTMLIEST